jgi:DNA-directed RNA polymerase specialized sigma24 family protein
MAVDFESAPDADLLRLAHSSEVAFTVFYRRYEKLVVAWLARRTGRADLAAELAAEVFAAAYIAAPRFRDGPAPAASWLLGIARHKLLRTVRRDR